MMASLAPITRRIAPVKTETVFLKRPRYLRVIPTLMLLTTAMAWGMTPDLSDSETSYKRQRATVLASQPDLFEGVNTYEPRITIATGTQRLTPGPSGTTPR